MSIWDDLISGRAQYVQQNQALIQERQNFIDQAAMRLYAVKGTRADAAFEYAEALWEVRERRRLARASTSEGRLIPGDETGNS